jgi:hypothetical protein
MKKQYLVIALSLMFQLCQAQFMIPTSYRGAFEPAPASPWTDLWTNWDCQNTLYPSATVTVSTDITSNTTWTASNTYLLQGPIYVKNNATLTIEPGTVILGDKNSTGAALFITKGAKLMAEGTANEPIVFTSNQPVGQRGAGDWGGIVLLGKANNNNPGAVGNIEGIAPSSDTEFGGGNTIFEDDNSGVLSFIRIEFGGYVYQPNKEINALTFGSVGSGTTIDHIQVSFCNDDAFEWFGGSVNCKYLVSYRNLDDDFDTDNGYSGKVQFGLVVRDPNISDNPAVSSSEGFESDNNSAGDSSTPQTNATFSNITLVGPLRGNVNANVASGYKRGARIRRNSALKIYNSIFMDFLRGVYIDGTACEANVAANTLRFKNNIVAGSLQGRVTEVNSTSTFNAPLWFGQNENDSIATTDNILTNPYDYLNPDYRPTSSSVALSGADFSELGMEQLEELTSIVSMFPNPASTFTTIQLKTIQATPVKITIYDLKGKEMLSYNAIVDQQDMVLELNTSDLNSGLYIVSVEQNNSLIQMKLQIQN